MSVVEEMDDTEDPGISLKFQSFHGHSRRLSPIVESKNLDRLPKAEVGTDEEKTKLVSQDSKESDVWKKKENNPPKPLEKKKHFLARL